MNRAKQILALYVLEQILGVTQRVLDRRFVRAYDYATHVGVDNVRAESLELVDKLTKDKDK